MMNIISRLVLVVGMSVLAAQAAAGPDKAAINAQKTVTLTYERRADGANEDRTRPLLVNVPKSVRYKDNFVRTFVSTYIGHFNEGVDRAELFWQVSKEPFAAENKAMYHNEPLKPFRDLDEVAREEQVPDSEVMSYTLEQQSAENNAMELADKHVHELVKNERKK